MHDCMTGFKWHSTANEKNKYQMQTETQEIKRKHKIETSVY